MRRSTDSSRKAANRKGTFFSYQSISRIDQWLMTAAPPNRYQFGVTTNRQTRMLQATIGHVGDAILIEGKEIDRSTSARPDIGSAEVPTEMVEYLSERRIPSFGYQRWSSMLT